MGRDEPNLGFPDGYRNNEGPILCNNTLSTFIYNDEFALEDRSADDVTEVDADAVRA